MAPVSKCPGHCTFALATRRMLVRTPVCIGSRLGEPGEIGSSTVDAINPALP